MLRVLQQDVHGLSSIVYRMQLDFIQFMIVRLSEILPVSQSMFRVVGVVHKDGLHDSGFLGFLPVSQYRSRKDSSPRQILRCQFPRTAKDGICFQEPPSRGGGGQIHGV